jgi:hypothetical protein
VGLELTVKKFIKGKSNQFPKSLLLKRKLVLTSNALTTPQKIAKSDAPITNAGAIVVVKYYVSAIF